MLFCKVSFVYVCLYVFYAVIYFRVWLCGCGYVGVVVRMSEFFLDPPLMIQEVKCSGFVKHLIDGVLCF